MASVSPVKNKHSISWRVQFRINGSATQESFETEQAARSFARLVDQVGGEAARAVRDARDSNDAGAPTLREFTEKYLDPKSGLLTGIEYGTRVGYEAIARRSFLQVLGDMPIDAITKAQVGQWIEWQEGQKSGRTKGADISAKTVRNYHALLSNIFKSAVDLKLRSDNPAHKTRMSRGIAREAVFLSVAEYRALHDEIPTYYQPLVAFLVGSQARWSEATALQGADLIRDTEPPTVRIFKAWKKNPGGSPVLSVPKTERGRRTVSIWPALVDLIGYHEPTELLFRGRNSGNQIWYGSFNTRIWKPAVARAGLEREPNIHDLRHTGASWLIADGTPLPAIQARLGHESITTTINTYGHLQPESHTRMANTLSGILGRSIES